MGPGDHAVSPSASQFFSPQEGSPSSGWGTPDHQFNQLDTDSDGVISREEFAASGAVRTTLYEQFKGHTTPPAVAARPPSTAPGMASSVRRLSPTTFSDSTPVKRSSQLSPPLASSPCGQGWPDQRAFSRVPCPVAQHSG